jgi:hypothetical protein
MCFDDKARPPIAPIAGGALDARDMTLASADGTELMAFAARAAQPSGAGMVVLPDIRGLHTYYKELTERFAEAGLDSITLDYFARTAETNARDEGFDFAAHVPLTRWETTRADVAAAISYLRSDRGGNVQSVFAMGFCFGGQIALLLATTTQRLSGVIGFYGWPQGSPRRPTWPNRRHQRLHLPGPGPLRRRRRRYPSRGPRPLPPRPEPARRRARDEGLRRRPPQLLRPPPARLRRRLRRRLAPRTRFHQEAQLIRRFWFLVSRLSVLPPQPPPEMRNQKPETPLRP